MNNFQCYTFLIRDGKGTPVWFYICFILSSAIKKKKHFLWNIVLNIFVRGLQGDQVHLLFLENFG